MLGVVRDDATIFLVVAFLVSFVALIITDVLRPYVDSALVTPSSFLSIFNGTNHVQNSKNDVQSLHRWHTPMCLGSEHHSCCFGHGCTCVYTLQDRLQSLSLITVCLTLFFGLVTRLTDAEVFQTEPDERSLQVRSSLLSPVIVLGRCQQPAPAASAASQCWRSVPTASADSQCQRLVPAVSVNGQCKQSVPALSASSRCQQSGASIVPAFYSARLL